MESTENKLTKENINIIIANSLGSENFYREGFRRFFYTDGVKSIANLGAYWILDIISSYQYKLDSVRFQVWELKVNGNKAVIICKDDDKEIVRQEIPYTDFPCDIKFYLIDGVLMLPSEY